MPHSQRDCGIFGAWLWHTGRSPPGCVVRLFRLSLRLTKHLPGQSCAVMLGIYSGYFHTTSGSRCSFCTLRRRDFHVMCVCWLKQHRLKYEYCLSLQIIPVLCVREPAVQAEPTVLRPDWRGAEPASQRAPEATGRGALGCMSLCELTGSLSSPEPLRPDAPRTGTCRRLTAARL